MPELNSLPNPCFIPVQSVAKSKTYLGIEIGGTKLQIVTGAAPKILERHRFPVAPADGAAGIRRQLESALPKIIASAKPDAVAVGFGGPVDWRTGQIARSHQIEGWSGFDLRAWLYQLTGAPVFVENDANTAALGEATHGTGFGENPVFYITLGSGVGGGLVVDGRIYHGATPGESEIGHLRLDRSGATVESRCSGWAVDAKIRALKATNPSSPLAKMLGPVPGGESRHLAAALSDPAAQQILRETAEDLAFALSHVVHLFHPQIIVIGGGLSGVGEPLRAAVETSLRDHIMEVFAPGPRIALSSLEKTPFPSARLNSLVKNSNPDRPKHRVIWLFLVCALLLWT
jgi:glucokinase